MLLQRIAVQTLVRTPPKMTLKKRKFSAIGHVLTGGWTRSRANSRSTLSGLRGLGNPICTADAAHGSAVNFCKAETLNFGVSLW